jgi:VanZ family protein
MSLSAAMPSQWRHAVFVCYVIVMLIVLLLPVPTIPLVEAKHLDKVLHFGIFLGFVVLFYIDRHRKVWWTFLLATAFAAGIELVQWILPYREGDWFDFLAGVAGAALGAVLVLVAGRQDSSIGLSRRTGAKTLE